MPRLRCSRFLRTRLWHSPLFCHATTHEKFSCEALMLACCLFRPQSCQELNAIVTHRPHNMQASDPNSRCGDPWMETGKFELIMNTLTLMIPADYTASSYEVQIRVSLCSRCAVFCVPMALLELLCARAEEDGKSSPSITPWPRFSVDA
jgi:hypothetical protein